MKSPITKVLLYVFGSIAAGAFVLVFILFVVFGVSLARTHQDILLKTAPSPDGKWLVRITDHYPGGDLMPSAIISIESTAPKTFFHLAERPNSVIYSMYDGCTLNSAFDARWASANVLTIIYPKCLPGPYNLPGDDSIIVKDAQWKNIAINYQIAKNANGE